MSKKNVTSSKYRKVKISKKNIIAKNRKEYAKIVILAVFLLVLTIGGSYALFQTTIKGTKQTEIVAGTLKVDYTDKNSITLNNASPLTDSEGLKQEPYTFTIKNIGTLNGKYTIYLEEKEGNTLDKNNIKYSIKEGDGDWSSPVLLSSGLTLKENRILEKEKEATYQIKMWLKEDAPNEVQGQTYSAKVVVDVVQTNIENIVTTNPIIKLNGESVVKINQNEEYVDAGISGIESTEKLDISKVKIRYEYNNGLETIDTNTIDTSKVGIYYIYYEVENSKGIKGVATRVVNVVRKGTNIPSITLKGEEEIVLDYKEKYIEAGYEARDVEDGILTDKVVVEGVVNSEVAGTYIIKYIIIDSEGNTASIVRKVIVNKKTNSFNATVTKKEIENISAVITIKSEGNEGYYAISSLDKKPGDSEYKKIEETTEANVVKNGRYYVYIKSKTGNIIKKIIDVTNIDETKPTCRFSGESYLQKNENKEITLTCTDPADIVTKAITKEMLEISDDSVGEIENITAGEKIEKGYQYKISIKGKTAGSFNLKLKDNNVLDRVGNSNEITESSTIKVVEMIIKEKTVKLDLSGIEEKQIEISGTNIGNLTYKSDNEDVAIVTDSGLIKAVAEGKTTITVTESNGKITEKITVIVIRKVKATFNKNGVGVKTIGATTASCEIEEVSGKCSVLMPTIETNSGYSAIGWNINKNATDGYNQLEEVEIEKDTVFYSISKKDAITLKATFNKNGAVSLDGKTNDKIIKTCTLEEVYNDEQQKDSCKVITPTIEASNETPIVIGYNEDKDAIIGIYGAKEEIEINKNKTYYALTKNEVKKVTITFNKNGAKTQSEKEEETIEKSCTIPITYNGVKQNETCLITSPTIEATTITPIVIGYSDNINNHTNMWSNNTAKEVSKDKTYYAQTKKEQEIREVEFKIAENSHVEKISLNSKDVTTTTESIKTTCMIKETYNGEKQEETCNVKSPTITPEKGYKNSFFGTAKDSTSGVLSGEDVSSINKIYYARAITGNNYQVNYYDGNSLKGTTNATVGKEFKLSSALSLLLSKEGYTFKGWTTEKDENEVVYNDSQTVKDLIKDDNGTIKLYAVWKDETNPVCVWSKPETITTGNVGTIELICTDNGSGISRKELTNDNFEISDITYGNIVEISSPIEVTNGYKYTIKYKGLSSGTTNGIFNISIKANSLMDISQNTNEKKTSESITVTGRTYTVTYVKGFSVSSLGATTNSCTTVGKDITCNITLPTIVPNDGFKVSGWFLNTTKVGNPGDKYELSDANTTNGKVELIGNVLDNIPPTTPVITNSSKENWATNATITLESTDSGSGLDSYELYDGEKWTSESITITDGIGKITYSTEMNQTIRFRAKDKFGNISEEATTKVKIDRTSPVCSFEVNSVNYNDTTNIVMSCKDTASGLLNQKLDLTNFTISNKTIGSITAISEGEQITNGYKYNITVKGLATGNFTIGLNAGVIKDNAGNLNASVVSNSITVNKINATNPTLTSYKGTYDEKSHTIEVSGGTGGAIQYSTDKTTWSTTKPTRTATGTTTVYVRVLGDSNHNTTEIINATITILRASMTKPSSPAAKNYTGSSQESGITCPAGSTTSGTTSATNAGTYSQTCTPDGNHQWNDGTITAASISWKINKVGATLTCSNKTYNGATQTGCSCSGGTVGGTASAINAGTYTASCTADSNHTSPSNKSWTISPKSVAVSWGTNTSFTYNGSPQAPSASANSGISGETINVKRTEATNAGSYTSTASCDSVSGGQKLCNNYSLTGTTKGFSIARAPITKPGSPAARNYNGSAMSSNISCPAGSTTSGTTSATNAGTYYQTCTPDSNHQWTDGTTAAASISWTINKIPAALTCNNKTYNGATQTGCSCSGGTIGGTYSAIDAGTYTASCTADSNHTSPSNVSWTISPKSVAVSWGATTSFTMNSLEQGPSASASSGISGETINVKSTKAIGVGDYTSTASCNSVSGGRAKCSNYSLTGTTKGFSIYGIKRTATFYANGNTISKSSDSCTTTGTSTSCSITAPTITAPANTPTVCGFTNSSSGTTSCSIGSGATITLSSNPTYYAQTYKGAVDYKITWNANGATIGANSSSCTVGTTYNGTAQGGCNITSPSIARTGYTIYGWNTDESATTSTWNVGVTKQVSNSATYYAITKDTTAPSCGSWSGESTTWKNGSRTISVGCSDSGSGCKQSTYSKTFTSTTEKADISFTISDNAGNTNTCSKTAANVYLDTGAPPAPTIYRGYQVFNRDPHTISCSNCTMTKVEQKADDNDYYTYKVQNTANNSRIIMIPGYDIKNAIGYIQSIDPANSTTNKVYYRMFYNTSATTFTSSSSYTTLNKLYLCNRNKFEYEYAPFKSSINLTKDKSALRMDIIKLNSDNSQVLKYTYSLGAGYVVAPAGQAEILQNANILVLAESSSVTDNADESGVAGVICKYGSDSKTLNSWDVYHDEESGSTTNEKGHYFFVKHFEYSSSNGDTINCSTYDNAGNSSTSVAIKINALKSK